MKIEKLQTILGKQYPIKGIERKYAKYSMLIDEMYPIKGIESYWFRMVEY